MKLLLTLFISQISLAAQPITNYDKFTVKVVSVQKFAELANQEMFAVAGKVISSADADKASQTDPNIVGCKITTVGYVDWRLSMNHQKTTVVPVEGGKLYGVVFKDSHDIPWSLVCVNLSNGSAPSPEEISKAVAGIAEVNVSKFTGDKSVNADGTCSQQFILDRQKVEMAIDARNKESFALACKSFVSQHSPAVACITKTSDGEFLEEAAKLHAMCGGTPQE